MDLKNNQITVRELLANPKAKEILSREFPDLINSPLLGMARNMSLKNVLQLGGGRVPKEKIDRVLKELKSI
ncbi:MAG: hypothetical protein K0R90_563 [Oscillospiraceae bacterium]|jgi:hypothetical protein|nr:hypothetical protein [Oscillospiraceae bacterium]